MPLCMIEILLCYQMEILTCCVYVKHQLYNSMKKM